MKFCPYCGAKIVNDKSSFCIECGKELPSKTTLQNQEVIPKENHHIEPEAQTTISDEQLRPECDYSYDGYYEDLLPIDNGQVHIGIDKLLVKRIAALAGGTLLVITLCLVMMYVF